MQAPIHSLDVRFLKKILTERRLEKKIFSKTNIKTTYWE